MRNFAGNGSYDLPEYFRGVCEVLDSIGPGDFMISTGDIDPPVQVRWTLDRYIGADYTWYPVVGNHEAETPSDMEYLRGYRFVSLVGDGTPRFRNGPRYTEETTWSFDYGNCHFIAINEYYDGESDIALDGDVSDPLYEWLAADLEATEKQHVFLFGHEPAYPRPDRDNLRQRHVGDSLDKYPDRRNRFWELLVSHDVVAYFCGHTHNYSLYERDGVWQVDAGHCRGEGDQGAASTFLLVHVDGGEVRVVAYRDVHDGEYDYDDIIHTDWLTSPVQDSLALTSTSVAGANAPSKVRIGNRPNPFNPSTRIEFDLPTGGFAAVRVYDARGSLICTLREGKFGAGTGSVEWDGRTDAGAEAPSGVYFALVGGDAGGASRKIHLVR